MDIQCESSMYYIKKKMTEIRRTGKRPIINNYYFNCEQDEEIFAFFGNETVVFWVNDRGVVRVYFYSVCPKELVDLLKQIPKGAVIDYLTRNEGEYEELFLSAGIELKYKMMRMVAQKLSPEQQMEFAERQKLFEQVLYMKDNVRVATKADCEKVYQKLYEVFDSKESHLCTKDELLKYIRNRWVVVYYEGKNLMGFNIFTVKADQLYGYQLWNGTGPEGYISLTYMANQLFAEYIQKNSKKGNVASKKPSYCWINGENRKILRLQEWQSNKFDGLYDFVYEK